MGWATSLDLYNLRMKNDYNPLVFLRFFVQQYDRIYTKTTV